MKKRKLLLIGIMMLIVVFMTGCGTEKNQKEDNNKEIENNNNVVEEQKIKNSNVGTFVQYDGSIYYWELDAKSREESGLYGNYAELKNHKNKLVKKELDGTVSTIFEDNGVKKICIANGRIYFEDISSGNGKICSVNIDGEDKKEYGSGTLKYIIDDYIYIQAQNGAAVIDTTADEYSVEIRDVEIIGIADSNVYYAKSSEDLEEMEIGYLKDGSDSGVVASFKSSEYSDETKSYALYSSLNVMFVDFNYIDDKVMVDLGYIAGTGYFVQEGWTITMDKDGKNVSKERTTDAGDSSESILNKTDIDTDYSDGLRYTNSKTGEQSKIISSEELNEIFDVEEDDESTYTVYSSDTIGNDIYVIVDYGIHNPKEDIGWRYSYKRVKTIALKYNLDRSNYEVIYQY